MSMLNDQPLPQQSRGDLWQEIIDDTDVQVHCSLDLIDLCKERRQLGIERYGMPLQINNGRQMRVDALQELLDAAVYCWSDDKDITMSVLQLADRLYNRLKLDNI